MKILKEHPKAAMGIAAAVLLFAVFNLFRANQPPRSAEQQFSAQYKAWVLQAEQLGGVLEDGASVLVLDRDRLGLGFDRRKYQRALDTLEKAGVSIEHIEKLIPHVDGDWDFDKPGFPYSEFVRAAEAYPDVDAIIAFCGTPYFLPGQERPDPSELPHLLVAASMADGGDAEALYDQGWVYAASVPRTVTQDVSVVVIYELLSEE